MPLSVVWNRSLGKAGSWYNIESVHHSKCKVLGRCSCNPPQSKDSRFPPFCVTSQQKEKCSVALRFFSLVPLADVLLRDNGIVRKHLS